VGELRSKGSGGAEVQGSRGERGNSRESRLKGPPAICRAGISAEFTPFFGASISSKE